MMKIDGKMGLYGLLISLLLQLSVVSISPAEAEDEMRDSATVLMYHRFGESRYPSTNISIEQFEAHLAHLAAGNYTVLKLDDIIVRLRAGELLPDRTVAITIDDAYLSVYTEAWPRLTEAGFPFTLFVASSPIDRELSGYMSWEQIRELQSSGVTIGSQTHTHPHMHRLSDEEVRAEISTSNGRFIEELGLRPELFAYPYGEYSQFVIDAVKDAGFRAAFGQNSGIMHSADDQFQLPRFAFNEAYGTIDRLKLAVDGLPLKVHDLTPEDMVLTTNPPLYGFTVSEEMSPVSQLRCFSNNHGKLDVTMLGMRAEIRAPGPLTEPRARINCTMPAVDGRWRWFGRQFLTR
ncbi:MAG: polysaccharide deacetylase family protein [Alphaproteobacteria bacterium]|jgi:peptidoglycan/xylan/chitin deacetylase (PgdA/CDA1 family)|nr:polysaccharide deacetylase family protein [Alphaproteobacteria bacterium]